MVFGKGKGWEEKIRLKEKVLRMVKNVKYLGSKISEYGKTERI